MLASDLCRRVVEGSFSLTKTPAKSCLRKIIAHQAAHPVECTQGKPSIEDPATDIMRLFYRLTNLEHLGSKD